MKSKKQLIAYIVELEKLVAELDNSAILLADEMSFPSDKDNTRRMHLHNAHIKLRNFQNSFKDL